MDDGEWKMEYGRLVKFNKLKIYESSNYVLQGQSNGPDGPRFFCFFYFPYSILHFLVFLVLLCFCVLVSAPVYAGIASDIRQGNKFYAQGDYEKAHEKYNQALQKDQESDIINFNTGVSSYKIQGYDEAAGYFQKALLSEDDVLRHKAHYNLGNTFYRMAEGIGPKNPQQALPYLEKSLAQYERALEMVPGDEDAKVNYDFVKKVLEQVKKQFEQQQQQCDNPKGSEKKEERSEQEKQSQGQNQDQQEKEQESRQQENKGEESEEKKDSVQGKEQQEQEGERSQGQDQEEKSGSQSSGQEDQKNLSKREAQMRLNNYENNEEPKQMLNLRGRFDERPVLKDW